MSSGLTIDGHFFLFYPLHRWLQGPWDQFIEHGTNVEDLRRKYGLTVENLLTKVKAQFADAPLELLTVPELQSRA